ncbi:MAG: hypothetical protein MI862_18920, partial [Desulfobacterales bacterium]|nr:hypothetical protein [Desulfobacterales bacterium]
KTHLSRHEKSGARLYHSMFLYLLAQVAKENESIRKALDIVDKSLDSVTQIGERWWAAEIHRLKGELLMKLAPDAGENHQRWDEAATSFKKSLKISSGQHARSLELRAAVSYAGMLKKSGRLNQAYTLLSNVYNQFTEGFEMRDQKEALGLLKNISQELAAT